MYRLVATVVLLVVAVVSVTVLSPKKQRADFVFANRGDVFTLDPQRMSWLNDMQIAYCLYEGVVRWNTEDFSVEPAAAKEIHVSDDKKTYTFTLREDAKWSNGAPVTAHDFRYAWMRLLTPDTSSDYSGFFFSIQGAKEFWDWRTTQLESQTVHSLAEITNKFNATVRIDVPSDYELVVTLEVPVPYFLDQLALAVCSPVYKPVVEGWDKQSDAYVSALSSGWHTVDPPPESERKWISVDETTGRIQQQYFWARPETFVGNGPFVLQDWRYKRDMWLEKNPLYHSPHNTSLDSIQSVVIPDANTAVFAFENGEIDWLNGVNVEYQVDMLEEKAKGARTNIHATPTFGTDFFSFNCREKLNNGDVNPLHHASVRRAFVHGTNRREIVDQVTRLREPIVSSIVPPNSIDGYSTVVGLGFDAQKAKQELRESGWEDFDGDGYIEDAQGTPFPTIDLLYTTNTPRYKWIALALRDQWKKNLGVRVSLRGTDNKFFSADLRSGNFMVARGRWYGDYGDPTTFLDIFQTENGNNDRGYSNASIDTELTRAENELDPVERYAILRGVEEKLFTQEVPMLVVCQLLQISMYDPSSVAGLTTHPRLVQHLWKVTTKDVGQQSGTTHQQED